MPLPGRIYLKLIYDSDNKLILSDNIPCVLLYVLQIPFIVVIIKIVIISKHIMSFHEMYLILHRCLDLEYNVYILYNTIKYTE